jgi:PPM family protein phosphatase
MSDQSKHPDVSPQITPPLPPADTTPLPDIEAEIASGMDLKPTDLDAVIEPPAAADTPTKTPIVLDVSPVSLPVTAPISTADLSNKPVIDLSTRPLPLDAEEKVPGLVHTTFGQVSDVGKSRSNNQDAAYSFFSTGSSANRIPDIGVFIVADGMGGHQDGEKASAIAVQTVSSYILDRLYMPLIKGKERDDAPITEILENAIQNANLEVTRALEDGGTTVTCVVTIGDLAYIGHVGDSRMYLIHGGKIEQLSRDHSWVQRLIELDQLTPEEATEHPNKNLLYRALGQSEMIEVDTSMRRVPANARIVLCSDGLWGQVQDREILEVVSTVPNAQDACRQLIDLANSRGGIDNITVVILQLPAAS